MAGQGFGPAGGTQTAYNPTTGSLFGTASGGSVPSSMSTMAANNPAGGAVSGNAMTANSTPTSPQGLLQSDNSGTGFQLAPTSQAAPPPAGATPGTNIMGTPSWMEDWTKAGSPDLNTWYQQNQGGYMDMSKPQATPAQLQFAPPPPPAAAAAPAAAPAATPQQPAGNWYTPKSGPAPAVTKNSLFGSSPVGQAELDALPDAFVSSQAFLNQYGSSPSAVAYQQWRMGAPAWFGAQNQQNDIRRAGGYATSY